MGLFAWFKRAHSGVREVSLTTSQSTTGQLDVRSYAGGTVRVSSGVTLLTFWNRQQEGDTELQYYNKDDSAVTLTVASTKDTQLPPELYDMAFAVIVANTSGTATFALKG